MNEQPHFCVERVHCCVCDGSGKVPRLVFWKRNCSVCEGAGKRRILISSNLSEPEKAFIRRSALSRISMFMPASTPSLADDYGRLLGLR